MLFRAGAFLAVVFFAVVFLAVVFRALVFFAVVFFALAPRLVVLREPGFLLVVRFVPLVLGAMVLLRF